MRKLATLIAIALAALLLASACSGDGGREPAAAPTPTPPLASTVSPEAGAEMEVTVEPAREIETSQGVYTIEEVQVTDRWPPDCTLGPPCDVAEEGYKMLVVSLKPPEDLEVVTDEEMELLEEEMELFPEGVHISGSDGSRVDFGLLVTEFGDLLAEQHTVRIHILFTPSESAHDFTLHWPGNPPIDLGE